MLLTVLGSPTLFEGAVITFSLKIVFPTPYRLLLFSPFSWGNMPCFQTEGHTPTYPGASRSTGHVRTDREEGRQQREQTIRMQKDGGQEEMCPESILWEQMGRMLMHLQERALRGNISPESKLQG